ncbi:MAG: hypothetical protein ACXVYV_07890 [Gaiellales bacterium]
MDLLIAVSQGLGLAVAAGFMSAAPLALAATAASLGLTDGSLSFAGDPLVVAAAWVATGLELVVDALWPGAGAGARLARRVLGGGLAFELVAGDQVPLAGLAVGGLVAAAAALSLREIRSRAIKSGGDIRGTALIEDGAGVVAGAAGLVPVVGYLMALAAGILFLRSRRRNQDKYRGLRVLR